MLAGGRSFVRLQGKLTPLPEYAVNALGIPGLYFQREQQRFYPHGTLAPHVVGFTGLDNQGLTGIEQSFDEVLRGSAQPLTLSIDLRVQPLLARALAGAIQEFSPLGAAGVVLDARNGRPLARVGAE